MILAIESVAGADPECEGVCSAELARLPRPMHSKSEIVKAGKVLRECLTEEAIPAIEAARGLSISEAFKIAHGWRDAHMLPLLRVRMEMSRLMRSVEKGAVAAARLKRMASIRKKLQKPITLYQMQDIAGCRAIVRSMKEVDRMVEFYRNGGSRHAIQSQDAYIVTPKPDGYRSHHLILKFNGRGPEDVFNRQTVEIQIRTKLQHAWATAVEAVGLIRHENIKGGEGDADWRRFFQLMSAELAYQEDQATPPTANMPREDIRKEIRDLSKKIKAISTLETYNKAINVTDKYGVVYAKYYLLQFDYETREVYVEPFVDYISGAESYIEAEKSDARRNSVLVEVNKVDDLKKAFPNYFLDVHVFTERLRAVIMPNYKNGQAYDLSWLNNFR